MGVAYHFNREIGEVRIEQSAQIWEFLKEFGYEDCKPAVAPALHGPTPCAADCDEPCEERWDMEAFVATLAIYTCVHAPISVKWSKYCLDIPRVSATAM